MTASRASSVVWPVWVVTLVSVVAGRVVVNAGSQDLQFLIFALITGSVGTVLASRIPSNPTGWVLFVVGVWLAARSLVPSWFRAEGRVGDAAWVAGWAWIPPLVLLLILMPLIFPNGRLLSARWRPVALAAGIGGVAYTLYAAFGPYLGSSSQAGANPYHIPGVATGLLFLSLLTIPAWVGAVASMVARFRGSRGVVRQQIKFVVYSLCAPSSALLLAWGVAALLGELTMTPTASLLVWVVVSFIPVAIGVAVLKYRLYDIDRLISRTVSYGLVVATLGAVFVAVAIGLPQLGGVASNEPILVAAATLAVAALFNPLRRRTQARVDRRFNRARYDAEREVESFAERLRTEMELDEVSDELIAVVAKTMHPTSAKVWIKEAQP